MKIKIGLTLAISLLLSFPNRPSLAEDDVRQKANSEGRQLRQEGPYAEAEKAHLLAVV